MFLVHNMNLNLAFFCFGLTRPLIKPTARKLLLYMHHASIHKFKIVKDKNAVNTLVAAAFASAFLLITIYVSIHTLCEFHYMHLVYNAFWLYGRWSSIPTQCEEYMSLWGYRNRPNHQSSVAKMSGIKHSAAYLMECCMGLVLLYLYKYIHITQYCAIEINRITVHP